MYAANLIISGIIFTIAIIISIGILLVNLLTVLRLNVVALPLISLCSPSPRRQAECSPQG